MKAIVFDGNMSILAIGSSAKEINIQMGLKQRICWHIFCFF